MKNLLSLILLLSFTIKAQDVTIGKQTWTSKNLNVSKYKNGDTIPQVQDPKIWQNITTGAWCYYENKTANGTKYGKLYNWYAVMDPRGLAPIGYHIPSLAEWRILNYYLGGELASGLKMKSSSGWKENGNGFNTSGFNALPGGYLFSILSNVNFYSIGANGHWWSSSELEDSDFAWCLSARSFPIDVGQDEKNKHDGLSVRCLKD